MQQKCRAKEKAAHKISLQIFCFSRELRRPPDRIAILCQVRSKYESILLAKKIVSLPRFPLMDNPFKICQICFSPPCHETSTSSVCCYYLPFAASQQMFISIQHTLFKNKRGLLWISLWKVEEFVLQHIRAKRNKILLTDSTLLRNVFMCHSLCMTVTCKVILTTIRCDKCWHVAIDLEHKKHFSLRRYRS